MDAHARGVIRRVCLFAVVALATTATAGNVARADVAEPPGESPGPAQWPSTPSVSPELEGWANALRLHGLDRYQTGLAMALALRGEGDFPFDTADRSSGGAATLAAAGDWWGLDTCPRAVIVVAGDSPADSLAASALSDPTGESSEPYLQRTSAADPLFDPIGGFARVDTDGAPVVVTRSARQGATALSAPARAVVQDLRRGGCSLARQAIVVGGSAAVPSAVDAELVAVGYDEVFRVSGNNRFATAVAVARSLGTASTTATACVDPVTDDGDARMGFYANSVVELRDSARSCRLLTRTVVLADGLTGADALAAGWWISYWQVPVLLHDGTARLPEATRAALETFDADNVVVLGGPLRVPEVVAAEAEELTGAEVTRIAGDDRYATSVQMAARLGGWWPTGDAADFAGSLACVAASSGSGATALGWPDALGAGPWCARANGSAADPGAPSRALAPTTGAHPAVSADLPQPAHDAAPVLLVRAQSAALPASVAALLEGAFDPDGDWCSSDAPPLGCVSPGFVVAFGGDPTVPTAAIDRLSAIVGGGAGGGDPTGTAGHHPELGSPFVTSLDMAPVYGVDGVGDALACFGRGGYDEVRFVVAFADAAAARLSAASDVMLEGRYRSDADGVVRSPGSGAPTCLEVARSTPIVLRGVSLSGRVTPITTVSAGADSWFTVAEPLVDSAPTTSSGEASDADPATGGVTSWTFTASGAASPVTSRAVASTVGSWEVALTLTRGVDALGVSAPDQFSASWTLTIPLGTVTGSAAGEAHLDGGVWHLRGRSTFTGGTWNVVSGSGGFSADVATNAPGDATDDAVAWQVDGVVAG